MIHHIRHRIHKHTISFKHAFEGLFWALRTQPNYIIHITLSSLAVLLGITLSISKIEWVIVVSLISIGLSIETLNSSIEQTLDCISLERRPDIKIAKDASAAAMLIFSIGSAVAAWIIFQPYLFP